MAKKDMLGARGGADARESTVARVSVAAETATVDLATKTGHKLEFEFSGVSRVLMKSPEGMGVRDFSEVASSREARVFAFANADGDDERFLKVAAARARWRRDGGPWREC